MRGVLIGKARISDGFAYGSPAVAVRPGETFYQTVAVDPATREVVSAWCGRGRTASDQSDWSICLVNGYDGYAVAFAPTADSTPSLQLSGELGKEPMTTAISLTDIVTDTPVNVELRLSSLNANAVELKAIAVSDGKPLEVATLNVPFDIEGHGGTFFGGSSLVFDLDKRSSALGVKAKVMKIEVEPLKPFTPSRR
jgi:hypothetical protein